MATIKVIDDDVEQADDILVMLEAAGHTVTTANSVAGAVEALVEDTPDLLVLDVMFPENPSAGLELAMAIRQQEQLQGLPVILLTNVNQEFPLGLSAKDIDPQYMPVQDFIEKPVAQRQLLEKVDALLSRSQ